MLSSKLTSAAPGPSGDGLLKTLWFAARSDRKRSKSDYTSTDISTAVERIMYPAVPMAMRMSSHLLLGIVRIYSEQVESLLRDSNILLIKIRRVCASTDRMNLSPFESVTLPDKFELDALDIGTDFSESSLDNHRKDPEEITLEDHQNLAGQTSYMVVSFDEAVRNSVTGVGATLGTEDPGPSNHRRLVLQNAGSPSYPGTEIMRDASLQYFPENGLFWPDQSEGRLEPDWVLMEMMEQTLEADTLGVESVSPLPAEQHQHSISVMSEQGLEFSNSDGSASPVLPIRSVPPPQQRRSHPYDHATILSNRCMKKRIIDSSSILRPRKKCPRDALGSWKLNNRIKKDAIFFEPLLTGLGSELCEAYRKDFISGKPYLSPPVNVDDMEIDHEISAGNNFLLEHICSPDRVTYSPNRFTPSPTGGHDCTPALGSDTSSLFNLREPASCSSTSDLEASSVSPGSDEVTPSLKGRPGVKDAFGPNIPELRTSCDGELSFLAQEDNYSPGPQETTPDCFFREHSGKSEVEPLSARTRAVAQFLKNRSSVIPIAESQSVNVSLKTILEGKTRKVCARMVFETLVLKNCGLVDVQQEESFGDVVLTVTPKLSNDLFSP